MKVNAEFGEVATVKFDEQKYIPSPAFGVDRFMLDRVGGEKARATTIVRYKPNSKFPEHTHIGGEEFLVLEGKFHDQFGSFGEGYYVRNPIDSVHEPWVEGDGCTIFVKLLQMADTGEGTDPLHIDTKKAKEDAVEGPLGKTSMLYTNEKTGEKVEMHWIEPNTEIPVDEAAANGEEVLVVEGSLTAGSESGEYTKWGWLRFPVAKGAPEDREKLNSGPKGVQIYRKTGHLTTNAMDMEKIKVSDD
eukprot:Clim_evm22s44 gene=Clim_evmTU22s44